MSERPIRFSKHAEAKFEVLRRHGLSIDKEAVTGIVGMPGAVFEGYSGRKITQGALDDMRVLRVVYEDNTDAILIITFYPGKRERYEKSKIQ